GVRAWEEGWWELPLTVGDQVARIVGAPPGSVSMHQNVTIAEAIVLSCFEPGGERRRIVYEEGNFPSVRYLYQAAPGFEVVVGPGAAWLYVRPELAERLEPALTGWQAHARPFAFEPRQDYADGAARFLTGTPNVPALYAATAGYDVIEEVGVARIRERSLEQTTLLLELLDEHGLESGTPRDPARRGGTVAVRVADHESVCSELAAREIICDSRPDVGLRLGPHFFNIDDELRHAVEQIVELTRPAARPGAPRTPAPSARPRA